MEQNLKLFVNYRRADHPEFVETIRTWFLHRYGRENVFMDFDSILAGHPPPPPCGACPHADQMAKAIFFGGKSECDA
jgi:hypothetical protein